jgi:hypothetical protein
MKFVFNEVCIIGYSYRYQ